METRLIFARLRVSAVPIGMIAIQKAFPRERFTLDTAAMGVWEHYPQVRQGCREAARNIRFRDS